MRLSHWYTLASYTYIYVNLSVISAWDNNQRLVLSNNNNYNYIKAAVELWLFWICSQNGGG